MSILLRYFFADFVESDIAKKLDIDGKSIRNPKLLNGTSDISLLPSIDKFDVYKYLVETKVMCDHKQMKDFKSLVGYQLYAAGYVESVVLCTGDIGVDDIFVINPYRTNPMYIWDTVLGKGFL